MLIALHKITPMLFPTENKVCLKCKQEKPLEDFHRNESTKDGWSYCCKSCVPNPSVTGEHVKVKIVDGKKQCTKCKKWKPLEAFGSDKKLGCGKASWCLHCWKLNQLYHITSEDYDRILVAQNGVCAICGEEQTSGKSDLLCVDHNHVTGKVRGLLCHGCNTALGNLKDDPNLMRKAAKYIELH